MQHLTDTDFNVVIMLDNIGDFISTEPFVVTYVNLKNLLCDFLFEQQELNDNVCNRSCFC